MMNTIAQDLALQVSLIYFSICLGAFIMLVAAGYIADNAFRNYQDKPIPKPQARKYYGSRVPSAQEWYQDGLSS